MMRHDTASTGGETPRAPSHGSQTGADNPSQVPELSALYLTSELQAHMAVRTFEEWESSLPASLREDVLWKVEAYRLALFLSFLARHDCARLREHPSVRPIADQLLRAVGSIGANIAEGYSRSGKRDRAHFYEYALGSARESRHWYLQAHAILSEQALEHRFGKLTQIMRLLTTMIRSTRIEPAWGSEKTSDE